MAGNDSPRLVTILIRLARNWANAQNRYERFEKRQRLASASAVPDDDKGEALGSAYHDHPFPGFVRFVDHHIGFGQDAIRAATLKEFDSERDLVAALNALDDKGVTAKLFGKLRGECPDIVERLFATKNDVAVSTGPDTPPLADLLDRAGKAFSLARTLGQELEEDHKSQGPVVMAGVQPPAWQRHGERIKEFVAAVLGVRDMVQNPPDGLDSVVKQLREAGKYGKLLASRVNERAYDWDILDLWPNLNQVAHDGYEAVKAVRKATRLDDPFAAFEEPKTSQAAGAVEASASGQDQPQPDKGDLIERLLAGPNDVELTPRELALLDAHLKQPIDFAAVEPERHAHPTKDLETWNRHSKLKLIRDFNRNLHALVGKGVAGNRESQSTPSEKPTGDAPKRKQERSTEKWEGQTKLIAALTKHHQYADDGCLNLEPIGNNELARLAGVDQATASAFFKKQFKGHSKYKTGCADATRLGAALRLLNDEFSPHLLYGTALPDEDERGDE